MVNTDKYESPFTGKKKCFEIPGTKTKLTVEEKIENGEKVYVLYLNNWIIRKGNLDEISEIVAERMQVTE